MGPMDLAHGDGGDGRHAAFGYGQGALEFNARLGGAHQLAEPGAQIRQAIMLQVKALVRQRDMIDRAVGPVFYHTGQAGAQPFLKPQAVGAKERVTPFRRDLPAEAAGSQFRESPSATAHAAPFCRGRS